ncbi:MAG: S6e family ribosomal protein [Nanoarchaeota archaeon]
MPIKFNISQTGKTFHLEAEVLEGKKIGEKISGNEFSPELAGYELEITGISDSSGFPSMKNIESEGRKRVLMTKGEGMNDSRQGMRLKKTLRGNTSSKDTAQINLKVLKQGEKRLEEIFPTQCQPKEKKTNALTSATLAIENPEQKLPENKTENAAEKK